MSENGAQLIFSELLARHKRIQVPLIQRDYAQGRPDQQEVREEFLAALHEALCLPPEAESLPLNLDFIYGGVEGQSASCFQPLDGQQRLTTLFLLHWYLAWRDGRGEDFRALFADGAYSRFRYHIRPSSSEFFDALVAFQPSRSPDDVDAVSTLVVDQSWYFRNWRLDPTIQSALVMLDAIHRCFRSEHGLYARLIDIERPAITFQLLDLKHFGLSDDLYIKMNSRGKPLTPFETFKARYEQTLKDLFPDEQRILDGQSVSMAEFFSRRMDTRWADFFWPHRDPDTHVFDAAVMNVFRGVILITRSPNANGFVEDVTLLRNRFQRSSYSFFHQRDWLDRPFAEMLMVLLEAWSADGNYLAMQLPDDRYFNEKAVFGKLLADPIALGYEDVVQLAAYAQYLKTHGNQLDSTNFQAWMRVIFNLSVNTEYNRPADLQRSLAALTVLAPHMTSILDYLVQAKSDITGFNQQQVAEEKLKARMLLVESTWRTLIEHAERHGYFRGQIGFLLSFSGISVHPAAEGDEPWSHETTQRLQCAFRDVLQKACAMFGDSGLNTLPDYRWERALLALGNYLLAARRNDSFLVNAQAEQASWKRLLRGAWSRSPQGEVLRTLWERLRGTANLDAQLDAVIAEASGVEEWCAALIAAPEAIAYCQQRMIRHTENGKTYLLRRVQMNGAHAELFTYCLYTQKIAPAYQRGCLRVLAPDYVETNTAEDEPHVRLRGKYGDLMLVFTIEFDYVQYEIKLLEPQPGCLPDALLSFFQAMGFAPVTTNLLKQSAIDQIERDILEIDEQLRVIGRND